MKLGKTILLVMACLTVLVFSGLTTAKAELTFESFQGTWWAILKDMDKGYEFPPISEGVSKAQKHKEKKPKGYLFFPDTSLDDTGFDNIISVFPEDGGWGSSDGIGLTIIGGTPNDFVGISEDYGEGNGMTIIMRVKSTEDKKNLTMIKSGKMDTLGGVFFDTQPDDNYIFAGEIQFKAKWVPESKVPPGAIATKDDALP